MRNTEQTIHIGINLVLSESTYDWYDPRATLDFSLSIPLEMFETKKLSEMIEKRINLLKGEFTKEKAEYERKQAEKEAEEARAKQEATV